MIVRRLLAWSQSVPEEERVASAAALARTFLDDGLHEAERTDAEAAVTLLLDDPSPAVRKALAEVLADAPRCPRHVALVLAGEPGETGRAMLERSAALTETDLIDRLATGDAAAQAAIARRCALPAPVAAALAEVGEPEALAALAANSAAPCPPFALARMLERHGDHAGLRAALAGRTDLPVAIRHALHVATARALFSRSGTHTPQRIEVAGRETAERAAILLASHGVSEREEMVDHLRRTGQLTAGLLLRAAAQGAFDLVACALARLSRVSERRVRALIHEPRGSGLAALCERAGLGRGPSAGLQAAVRACLRLHRAGRLADGPALHAAACRDAAAACADDQAAGHHVISLFHRLEAEFARDAARQAAERLMEQHRLEEEAPRLIGAPLKLLPAPASFAADPHAVVVERGRAAVEEEPSSAAASPAATPEPDPAPRPQQPLSLEEQRRAAFALILEEAAVAIAGGDQDKVPKRKAA